MLRREKYEQRASKKRRILEINIEDQEEWRGMDCCAATYSFFVFNILQRDPENEEATDIRDLEFSMANDLDKLKSKATALTDKDINLIKLIICSALYPQLAIGDEHNPYRKSNEIVFHTPCKLET